MRFALMLIFTEDGRKALSLRVYIYSVQEENTHYGYDKSTTQLAYTWIWMYLRRFMYLRSMHMRR